MHTQGCVAGGEQQTVGSSFPFQSSRGGTSISVVQWDESTKRLCQGQGEGRILAKRSRVEDLFISVLGLGLLMDRGDGKEFR